MSGTPSKPTPLRFALRETTLGIMATAICETVDAAPAAVLAHLAAVVGTAVGRGPSTTMLGEEHTNLYVLVVGKTGYGRKGTSWGPVRRASFEALPLWADEGILSGLSTGEGLLAHFRGGHPDESLGAPPPPPVEPVPTLLIETEFASVLKRGARDGSTLTELLRQLWEDHRGGTITRKDPLRVSGAHLSVCGHVTPADLLSLVQRDAILNGTMNRFLAVWSERTGPRRTRVDRGAMIAAQRDVVPLLRDAVEHGRSMQHVEFSDEAGAHWDRLIVEFDREPVTTVDDLSQRAASYLARLALIFAIVDRANRVELTHVRAAEEVWRYSVQTWRHIYGDRVSDPLAAKILDMLAEAPGGLTRSQIRENLSSSQKKRLDDIRAMLEDGSQRVWVETMTDTGGRPAEVWHLTPNPDNHANPDNSPGLAAGNGAGPVRGVPVVSGVPGPVFLPEEIEGASALARRTMEGEAA